MNTTTNAQGCRTTKDYDVDIFALQNVRTREKTCKHTYKDYLEGICNQKRTS